jgi:hypothetical protein
LCAVKNDRLDQAWVVHDDAYLMTTTSKSGSGGAVFLNGVGGLYKLKNTLYGDPVSDAGCLFRGALCPAGAAIPRRAWNSDAVNAIKVVIR